MDRTKKFEEDQKNMSDQELVKLVTEKLSKLCKTGGKSLVLCIPPSITDFDMLVCELVRRYKEVK